MAAPLLLHQVGRLKNKISEEMGEIESQKGTKGHFVRCRPKSMF